MNSHSRVHLCATVLGTALFAGLASFGEVNLRFGFITDTHINEQGTNLDRMRGAFTLFRSNDVDLVVHGGDIANSHFPVAYAAISNLFDEVFGATKPRFIAAVGNHDTTMQIAPLTELQAAEETLALVGVENTHTDVRTVNGYTFLTMPYAIGSTEKGFLSWADYEAAVSNACEAAAGRPVFVLEHEPPQDTVYNSHNWGYARSKEILAHYPQVVELSGHVHGSLYSDLFIWQGDFTVLNACCLDTWQGVLKDVAAPGGQNKPSYGALIVEVEDSQVVVSRYDVTTGEEIYPERRWVIPLPFDAATAPYNRAALTAAEVAPAFGENDTLMVTPGTTCRTFTLAFPEVPVNANTYWVTVESRDGAAWTVMQEEEFFSEFWKQPSGRTGRASVTLTSDDFEPLTDYRFSVQPVGQYGTRGAAITATATASKAGEKPDCFVEYVKSTYAQYFDTGVKGRVGTKMEMDISIDEVGGDVAILDCRKDESATRFFLFHTDQGKAAYGYADYKRQDSFPLVANRRYHVATELKAGLQTLDIDGARIATGTDTRVIDTGANLYLFACNFLTRSAPQYPIKARVYSLKIWQTDGNDVYRLVRDFAPCMAPAGLDADNSNRRTRAGALYDRVSGRIFFARSAADRSPSAAGSSRCGYLPDVWNTTSPGKPDYFVEYVCSSGSQVLDTGVPARSGLRAEGDVMFDTTFNGTEEVFLGVSDGNFCTFVDRPNGKAWGSLGPYEAGHYFTNETTGVETKWNLKQKYHFTCDFSRTGESTITQDGAVIYRTPGGDISTGRNLMMFASCRSGWPAYTSKARCYGLKLWFDDVLVRDFRPCVKGGRPGLYDAVRNEVVFPLGDWPVNDTTVGPAVNEDGSLFELPWVEIASGQYVDVGVIGRSGTKVEMDILFPNANDGGDHAVMGSRKDSTDSRFFPFHQHQNCGRYGYVSFKYLSDPVADNTRLHVESDLRAGSQVIKVNDTTIVNASDATVVDTGVNMYLGAVNYGGPKYQWPLRVYSLKIWQTDTTAASDVDYKLVRDFVPVMAAEKSAALLDRVSGQTFTPKNTGKDGDVNFRFPVNAPNKVSGRPDALVEYIESDGRQFLQTGVQVQSGISASGEMMWTGWSTREQTHLGASWWPNRLYLVHSVGGKCWFGHTKDFGYYPLDPLTNDNIRWGDGVRQRYDVDYTDRAHLRASIDGVQIMDAPCETELGATSSALGMFAAAVDNWTDFPSKSRCYWSQIRVNGVLERDFLPCVKDGKGGLYDAAHDEIYFPTIGEITGGLIGPITNGTDLAANTFVQYAESDGNAWIDTGVIGRSGTKVFIEFTPNWAPNAGNDWSRVDMGLIGARPAPWGDTRFYPAHSFGGVLDSGYGTLVASESPLTDNATHKVESELRAGLQRVTLDGVQVVSESNAAALDTGLSMYLGAVNVGGEATYRSAMRIHRVKIWQTATTNADDVAYALVRDYKPVVTTSGIIGLKDVVHNTLALPASPFTACGEPLATGCSVLVR